MHTQNRRPNKKEQEQELKRQKARLNQDEIRLRTLQHYGLEYRGKIQQVTTEPTAAEATEGEERRKKHGSEETRTKETKINIETTNLEDMESSEDEQSKNKKENRMETTSKTTIMKKLGRVIKRLRKLHLEQQRNKIPCEIKMQKTTK